MAASKTFRIVVLLAILAGTMSLGVNPAQAAPPPPELQDPETACVDFFGGQWLGGGDCFFGPPDYIPFFLISQGIYLGGFQAEWNELLAEFGCSPGTGVALPMIKIVFGPGPLDYIYFPDESGARCAEAPYGGVNGRAGDTDDAGTLSLKQPRNGFIQYDAGTCSGVCKVSGNLPVNADKYISEIPGTVSAMLYVQLGGGTGSYSACFWGEGQIYQRISGTWQAVATSIANGMSCAAGAGDGSYAFVEN
ncbi:MAG: hypothetical protein EPO32_04270 [Anaerolineae bacterium]|nr:MAG: hypothetical protein EPO32_04270 [Anaerolineae bacterium]